MLRRSVHPHGHTDIWAGPTTRSTAIFDTAPCNASARGKARRAADEAAASSVRVSGSDGARIRRPLRQSTRSPAGSQLLISTVNVRSAACGTWRTCICPLASLLLSLYMDWFVDPSRDDNTCIIIIKLLKHLVTSIEFLKSKMVILLAQLDRRGEFFFSNTQKVCTYLS